MADQFEVVEVDGWGTPWVRCPVCAAVKKGDGIIKHMIRLSQNHDTNHAIWLKENYTPRDSVKE